MKATHTSNTCALDRYRNKDGVLRCWWCTRVLDAGKITKDHLPADTYYKRKMIDRTVFHQKRTVPACYHCNQEQSKASQPYMLLLDIANGSITPENKHGLHELERKAIKQIGFGFIEWEKWYVETVAEYSARIAGITSETGDMGQLSYRPQETSYIPCLGYAWGYESMSA